MPTGAKLLLDVDAEGYILADCGARVRIAEDEVEVTIKVEPALRIRWPVVAGDVEPPADGTTLRLVPRTGTGFLPPEEGRMEGGELVVTGFRKGFGSFKVLGPSNTFAYASLPREGDQGRSIKFTSFRTVTVTVRDRNGQPQGGLGVELRNQGNNAYAEPVCTDEQGVARITGLTRGLADVYIGPKASLAYGGRNVGTVDLARGDGELAVEVESTFDVELSITMDGERRLPGVFAVRLNGAQRGSIIEDPEAATLRFSVRPIASDKSIALTLDAAGYPDVKTPLLPPEGQDTLRLELALESSAALVVKVVPPVDGRWRIALERRDAESGAWKVRRRSILDRDATEALAGALEPGRYRVRDVLTGLVSIAREIETGSGAVEVLLDLSRAGDVHGRVTAPEGTDLGRSRIDVTGAGIGEREESRVNADGTFILRVPGDRPLTLGPRHPLLVPAENGTATISAPVSDVALSLVAGPTLVFQLSPGVEARFSRVLLFDGAPEGTPIYSESLNPDGDGFRLGGYQPGRYTLFVDPWPFAPVILADVELRDGETDLGILKLTEGASIRVRVESVQATAPRLFIRAIRLDDPAYVRSINTRGEKSATLSGLLPGRYRVRINRVMDAAQGEASRETVEEVVIEDESETVEIVFKS